MVFSFIIQVEFAHIILQDFWDVKAAKKVGTCIAHCAAICEWAPDSRHFIAAVVSPRIRVDNGYKIFKYDGTLIYETAVNELYQVWKIEVFNLSYLQ